ncbi:MAG: hypothetical protein ACI837_001867 [Crocinitomicaceae bacterium]|jgi:hypothetical protein
MKLLCFLVCLVISVLGISQNSNKDLAEKNSADYVKHWANNTGFQFGWLFPLKVIRSNGIKSIKTYTAHGERPNESELTHSIYHLYDRDGKILEQGIAGPKLQTPKRLYHYDSIGKLIKKDIYDCRESTHADFLTKTCQWAYDSLGRVITRVIKSTPGTHHFKPPFYVQWDNYSYNLEDLNVVNTDGRGDTIRTIVFDKGGKPIEMRSPGKGNARDQVNPFSNCMTISTDFYGLKSYQDTCENPEFAPDGSYIPTVERIIPVSSKKVATSEFIKGQESFTKVTYANVNWTIVAIINKFGVYQSIEKSTYDYASDSSLLSNDLYTFDEFGRVSKHRNYHSRKGMHTLGYYDHIGYHEPEPVAGHWHVEYSYYANGIVKSISRYNGLDKVVTSSWNEIDYY